MKHLTCSKVAIEGKKLDEKAINEAKFKYAVAATTRNLFTETVVPHLAKR